MKLTGRNLKSLSRKYIKKNSGFLVFWFFTAMDPKNTVQDDLPEDEFPPNISSFPFKKCLV